MTSPIVGIYVRISKDDEKDELGVARQEKECRALVKQRGWKVAEVYRENNRSAFNSHRKEWSRMLADLEAGTIQVVVAWANDRLYRQVRDQLDLMERAKRIATVKDGDVDPETAEGKMRMGILANVAAFESERKSERHRSQHEQIAEAGTWPGGRVPYGYRKDGRSLRVEPKEAKALRDAAAAILDGASLRSVADRLGMYTRTAKRMLMNAVIAGRRVYRGQELRAAWPPILDVRTWRKVCEVLDDPARGAKGPRPKYLLSGIAVCGSCGSALKGHPQRGNKTYSCLNSDCGQWAQLRANVLDDFVWSKAADKTPAVTEVKDPADVPEMAELDALDDRMGMLAEQFAEGERSAEGYHRAVRAIEKKRDALEAKVAKRLVRRTTADLLADWPVPDDGADLMDLEAVDLSDEFKRAHLERTVAAITLAPAGKNRYMNVGDRVSIKWRSQAATAGIINEPDGMRGLA
jgi:site-specific DNA recombinase